MVKTSDKTLRYLDIGHTPRYFEGINPKYTNKIAKSYIWWWQNNRLHSRKITADDSRTHFDILGENGEENLYKGRAEISSQGCKITLLKPSNKKFSRIPTQLLGKLYSKYNEEAEIIIFDE